MFPVESDLFPTADFVLTLILVTNDSVPSFNVSIFCPVALGSIEFYLLLPLSVFTKLYSLFSGFSNELLAEAFLLWYFQNFNSPISSILFCVLVNFMS